jgi:hypothetical protein
VCERGGAIAAKILQWIMLKDVPPYPRGAGEGGLYVAGKGFKEYY